VANSAQPIALPNPFAAGCAWIDGKYVPIGEACIPILDTGFVRSEMSLSTPMNQDHIDEIIKVIQQSLDAVK